MKLGRVITAMVTPFDEKGKVDHEQLKPLIDTLITRGTEGIVIGGTTGESATLSMQEKADLYRAGVEAAAGRIPVIAGTGMNDTHATAELSRQAEKDGVDGVMLVAPYYNKPSQQGMYEHFRAIAEKIDIPVMIYNVPGRTMVNILPETTIALSHIPNITAVKEASGNLDQMSAIIAGTSHDFQVYSGDDSLTLPAAAVGADGIVSVSSHIIGSEMQEMLRHYHDGRTEQAAALHRKLVPFMHAMFLAPSPTPVKTALSMQGVQVGGVRLPLIPLNEEERRLVSEAMDAVTGINPTHLR
ncbi:4-hydroxy-tetrahydrodipicolinate synthase [Alkalicoccus urumqiensis]|uniref:4-hydroxy-tetrahydrodipicolinate synthase n=1 Tax=Alkalicoccus urumqiensis TaxID=1548213 RepID=A0A2P6MG19_ALKUR|nr:4-hydroxy-tetrahydrodipicolinate synthase [Alkalicoccus urumqiensis]PRO65180.1 4-hydroxy-tetrahydrodipicolinate synthase [Alkalicoccus urumqiensis]